MKANILKKGFTLIELLVVISIIGLLIALSFFGIQGARESSRDAKRKTDLESVRSALEVYKSDCNAYPVKDGYVSQVLDTSGTGKLVGDDSYTGCVSTNVYLNTVPSDPTYPNAAYSYYSDGTTYELCAALEKDTGVTVTCNGSSTCGSSSCNYKVVNP